MKMAGLTVLLEAQENLEAQIISKTSLMRSPPPPLRFSPLLLSPPTSPFLEACFLCKKHLCRKQDIYMYRGDRAFCSEECRCRQIVMDKEEESLGRWRNCYLMASPTRHRKRTGRGGRPDASTAAAAARHGFAY